MSRSSLLLNGALCIMAAITGITSLLIGPSETGISAIFAMMSGDQANIGVLIMQEIRLPRTILGLVVGATLGLSGATLQGFLRNPLAEPGIIGVSGAAALGAVIAIYTGLSLVMPLALPLFAIIGAILCVGVLQILAGRRSTLTLILAGIAVSSLTGASISLALNLSPNPFAAYEVMFWLLGSLSDRSMDHVALAVPFMLAGWVCMLLSARSLDALSLGEDVAQSLGVNIQVSRLWLILGIALSVGAATAVCGIVGFVGLLVPHILRPLTGQRPSQLLLPSMLGGAIIVGLADIAVRVIDLNAELKLGVLTAIIGAPFFLWLVLKQRHGDRM